MAERATGDHHGEDAARLVGKHLVFGWWWLLLFLTLGIALEAMHGFKVGWYLDVTNETRRLLWTLAHAHGVLLGLVNIAFALTLRALAVEVSAKLGLASALLLAASILVPGGFLLGGIIIYGGDPGLATVFMVPPGALLLLIAVLLIARKAGKVS